MCNMYIVDRPDVPMGMTRLASCICTTYGSGLVLGAHIDIPTCITSRKLIPFKACVHAITELKFCVLTEA